MNTKIKNMCRFIQRFLKFLTPRKIDLLYYEVEVSSYVPQAFTKLDLEVRKQRFRNKITYFGVVNGKVVHKLTLHNYVLLVIQSGIGKIPVMGDGITIPEYRGLRILPHVISIIISDLKENPRVSKVGALVSPDNHSSIRGIERAGLKYVSRIQGYRIGPVFIKIPMRAQIASNQHVDRD